MREYKDALKRTERAIVLLKEGGKRRGFIYAPEKILPGAPGGLPSFLEWCLAIAALESAEAAIKALRVTEQRTRAGKS